MREILQKIAQSPGREAKWLNTLSLLEYIGARKISKTVCESHPSLDVLKHFSDETRHAYLFKELSQKVSKGKCDAYLCPDEAMSYFQMLDASLTQWLAEFNDREDTYANYLLVTSMIERRAMKVYPAYREATKNPDVKAALDKIIQEEGKHRQLIETELKRLFPKKDAKSCLDLCFALEEKLFGLFEDSLKKQLH